MISANKMKSSMQIFPAVNSTSLHHHPALHCTRHQPTTLVMVALPTLTCLQKNMPSSPQLHVPAQHHSLPVHQTAIAGQQTFILLAPGIYQPPVCVQLPVQSRISTPTPPRHANISLEKYDGRTSAIQFWTQFMTFISIMNVPLDAAYTYFSFYFKDTAKDWYFELAPATQNLTEIDRQVQKLLQNDIIELSNSDWHSLSSLWKSWISFCCGLSETDWIYHTDVISLAITWGCV